MTSIFEPIADDISSSATPISMGNLILEFAKSANTLYEGIRAQRTMAANGRRLANVLEVSRDYGLNKPTMKIITGDPSLEMLGQTDVPSVESFDLVSASDRDPRTQKVMEAAMLALKTDRDGLREGLEDAKSNLSRMMSVTEFYLMETLPILKQYQEKMTGETISEEGLDVDIVQAVAADCLGDTIDKLSNLAAEMEPLNVDSVVTNSEVLDRTRAAMEEIGTTFSPNIGLGTDGVGNLLPATESLVDETNASREGTMRELGYHPEVVRSLVNTSMTLCDNLKNLLDKRTEFLDSYDVAQEAIEPVTTGVAGYSLEDHRDVMNSYTCLMTSVLDNSVQSIQTMLGVVESICE